VILAIQSEPAQWFLSAASNAYRPASDGYALNLEFKSWRIDPDLPDNAFVLKLPEGAQLIHLIEK